VDTCKDCLSYDNGICLKSGYTDTEPTLIVNMNDSACEYFNEEDNQ
jgi:hypothetical protein